jgi:dipeptidyl aminopeptidase/acylaminoacyl peptidase
MFKRLIISLLIIVFINNNLFSQNSITSNGHYLYAQSGDSLVVMATNCKWKKGIVNGRSPKFVFDETRLVYSVGDSMVCLTLGTDSTIVIKNVKSFVASHNLKSKWLACITKGEDQKCILFNIETGSLHSYDNVNEIGFSDNGALLYLKKEFADNYGRHASLDIISLSDVSIKRVWVSSSMNEKVVKQCFGSTDKSVAFIVQLMKDKLITNSIWYYQPENDIARLIIDNNNNEIEPGLTVGDTYIKLINNDNNILFSLKKSLQPIDPIIPDFELWSYTDPIIYSIERTNFISRDFVATCSLKYGHLIRIENEKDLLIGGRGNHINGLADINNAQFVNSHAIVARFSGDVVYKDIHYFLYEYNWNKATTADIYIISLLDGTRRLIKHNLKLSSNKLPEFEFSPDGQYVVFFDPETKNILSYDVSANATRNLTVNIKTTWRREDSETKTIDFYMRSGFFVRNGFESMVNWNFVNEKFIVYDHYSDIWLLDPKDDAKPINITNGLARKNLFKLTVLNTETVFKDKKVIFHVEDRKNHEQGVYRKDLASDSMLVIISMGAFNYEMQNINVMITPSAEIISFARESRIEPVQTFFTANYENIHPIITYDKTKIDTSIKIRVVTWKDPTGKMFDGVLRLPKGFDINKKYPVIVNCYEKFAAPNFNHFFRPYQGFDGINDEYFLNNGYIIFAPDIYMEVGSVVDATLQSITSGIKFISKFSFVNSKKIGISGGSFGGYITNLLVARTNLFAAAISSAGLSDPYGYYQTESLDRQGLSYSANCEVGQMRIGVNPWERPDLYIKNSAFFYADRVNTPLLMSSNKGDHRVPHSQSVDLFIALRRLGKKVWLLLGDDKPAHGGPVGLNMPIYYTQFFDHYLKDMPAPIWMTRGIPFRLKGTTFAQEYDSTMKTPGSGLLMQNDAALTPKQRELLKHKTTVNNDGRIVDVPADKPKKLKPKTNK